MPSRKPRHNPVSELALLHREAEQIFARLAAVERCERVAGGEWWPAVDVFESQDELTIVVEVPGVAQDALSVVCRNRQLVIAGHRRPECAGGSGSTFLCMERPHGRFTRIIPLQQQAVDMQRARARIALGLLTITIPRLKERRSREIVIPIEREEGAHD
jgi:HSP20 family protein